MKNYVIISLITLLLIPMAAYAGEAEDELIAKVTAAYGGDAVVNLTSYKITEGFIAPASGQSHSPDLTEVGRAKQVLLVDTKNNRAVYDTLFDGRGGQFQNATASDGEKAYTINYPAGTYGDAANADPHSFAGGTMRTSDVVLVYELNKAKDKAKIGDDVLYMNRPHKTLTMPFPLSPELKLYIDARTFLVSKMVRENPQLGQLDYVFSDYREQNGIKFASGTIFSIAGVPNLISTGRDISFNIDLAEDVFALSQGLNKEGDRIDTSEMLVNKISDGVYHVGQANGYSLFVDTTVGIVGAGGYPGLKDRLKRFQTESKNYKPLAYQVVTHHHSDHIGGISEAVALGARLVTVKDNVQTIKTGVTPAPKDQNIFTMESRTTFGDGRNRVEIYEISTIHATGYLLVYAPADKVIFIADHFGSPFASGTPVARQATVDLLAAIDDLGIDVRKIATAHNARIYDILDMRKSVTAFKPAVCSGDRPVCL